MLTTEKVSHALSSTHVQKAQNRWDCIKHAYIKSHNALSAGEIAANKEKVIKKEKADKSLAKKAEAGIVKKKTTKFKAARIRRGATVKVGVLQDAS